MILSTLSNALVKAAAMFPNHPIARKIKKGQFRPSIVNNGKGFEYNLTPKTVKQLREEGVLI